MSKWQTIDTVPRDGSEVLLWGGAEYGIASYKWLEGIGAWLAVSAGGYLFSQDADWLTHWMPLPEPPNE